VDGELLPGDEEFCIHDRGSITDGRGSRAAASTNPS